MTEGKVEAFLNNLFHVQDSRLATEKIKRDCKDMI